MNPFRSFLWTLPFLSFLLGYYSLNRIYHIDHMQTPSLVGKTVPEAFSLLSSQQLNMRILAEKEDPDLPGGTILSQTPLAHTTIKSNQAIFCVVSKKPARQLAPLLTGKTVQQYQSDIKNCNIRVKEYWIESPAPYGQCIAQSPQVNEPLEKKSMMIYLSAGNEKPILFPSCIGKSVQEVVDFFNSYNIQPRISHAKTTESQHSCQSCIVIDQRPLPGSLILLNSKKPILVQLHVAPSR